MLYRLVKLIMRIVLRIFYKRIYVTGLESIPHAGPLIIVCNHPSSMMDAVILGVLLERKIHFFTRGDIFSNPIAARILSALHMIPVFHHDAGRETINHNDSAFDKAESILKSGGAVVFFSEGTSHTDRRLLPLKKGAFRLALNMMHNNPGIDILLTPAGLNYAHPIKSNTEVIVNFSSPIPLQPYVAQYQHQPATAVLQLGRHCYSILRTIVLHINEKENDVLARQCLTINRSQYTFFSRSFLQGTSKKFEEEKQICERINSSEAGELDEIRRGITKYFSRLKSFSLIDDALVTAAERSRLSWKATCLNVFLPVLVVAYIFNALPLLIACRITIRKVKRPDFYTWVLVVSSAILYVIWMLVLFAGFVINGVAVALTIILLTLSTGAFAAAYLPALKKYRAMKRVVDFRKKNPDLFRQLLSDRTVLSSHIATWKMPKSLLNQ